MESTADEIGVHPLIDHISIVSAPLRERLRRVTSFYYFSYFLCFIDSIYVFIIKALKLITNFINRSGDGRLKIEQAIYREAFSVLIIY